MINKVFRKITVISTLLFLLQFDGHSLNATQISTNDIIAQYDIIDGTITNIFIDLMATHKQAGNGVGSTSNANTNRYPMTFNFNNIVIEELNYSELNGSIEIYSDSSLDSEKCYFTGDFTVHGNSSLKDIYFHIGNQNQSYIAIDGHNKTTELTEYFQIQSMKYIHILKELFNN